jgi:hypothetical protein
MHLGDRQQELFQVVPDAFPLDRTVRFLIANACERKSASLPAS